MPPRADLNLYKTNRPTVNFFAVGRFILYKINLKILYMSDSSRNRNKIWLAIGAIILIILLIVWLTYANLLGDTDVAASIPVF